MNKLRVFLADDHAIVREGLKLLIGAQPDMEVVGEAGDGVAACREAKIQSPDIMLMDVSMPEMNGAQATECLKATCPQIKIIVLSAYADEVHVRKLLTAGASGYVLKRTLAEELTNAIRAVAKGGTYLDPAVAGKIVGDYVRPTASADKESGSLSPREQEVLLDIARGYSNKEISERLFIGVKTVEGHKARVMEKMEFASRAELVRYALHRGWLHDD